MADYLDVGAPQWYLQTVWGIQLQKQPDQLWAELDHKECYQGWQCGFLLGFCPYPVSDIYSNSVDPNWTFI